VELQGKRVIISGGAGFIGRALVARLSALGAQITVVSRDEDKHLSLRRQFPEVTTRICDVRDLDLLRQLSAGHDVGIWAASLKQIETCTQNPQMAKEVILDGALNQRRVSEEHLEAAVFISTDKSRAPTTLYGYLKGAAGESFVAGSRVARLSTAVYGNVWNSTGSLIPAIWDALANDRELTLFDPDMTRFMIDAEEAVQILLDALDFNACYVLPRLESFRVREVFELYAEEFGLRYRVGRPRPSEKIHELLATAEELPRMRWIERGERGFYVVDLSSEGPGVDFPQGRYSSADHVVSKERLRALLEERNYFRA
jgi:UDP-N-acetylglucosamine 4,6-dehydratase/5-epimerase